MPLYAHVCDDGHHFDLVLKFSELEKPQVCECGCPAARVICAPMVFVQPNICYDSPVTGEAITSKQKRIEDLKRHNCIPYEEGMKQDHKRRQEEGQRRLEASVDSFVEAQVAQMPARKRESLETELKSGVAVDTTRLTPIQESAR
jgi:predicted nucleic acid-binding Zn ribbon protein